MNQYYLYYYTLSKYNTLNLQSHLSYELKMNNQDSRIKVERKSTDVKTNIFNEIMPKYSFIEIKRF